MNSEIDAMTANLTVPDDGEDIVSSPLVAKGSQGNYRGRTFSVVSRLRTGGRFLKSIFAFRMDILLLIFWSCRRSDNIYKIAKMIDWWSR